MSVTVQNLGGPGTVRVEGFYDAEKTNFDSKDWQKVYLLKNQIRTIHFDFDDSKFRSGTCKASVEVVK